MFDVNVMTALTASLLRGSVSNSLPRETCPNE